ncbi:MAG: HAD family hydrolase [Prolixibacteraceae bacterium]|nr:HAD family hydrolase [Prolixibacteraceae bacterium]MBN2774459.1 HAD family hydrolase [Prolixibacteraceae bacterium]
MPENQKNFCYKNIIWDWNGTLLNDLDLCVGTINILLADRKLPLLTNGRYKEVFSFPVKQYYEKAGFDFTKEDFAIPAREFIEKYNAKVNNCNLHFTANAVLEKFRIKKVRQFVLSAMKQDMLEATIRYHRIFDYFEKITGLDDHYAVSKIELGILLLKESRLNKNETCIIGDTLHDYEVAEELGVDCILIADGHQSKDRLLTSGVKVLNSLEELALYSG